MTQVGYFTHADCKSYRMGHMHPETPMRLQAIDAELQSQGLMLDLIQFESEPASLEQITRAHSYEHVRKIEEIGRNTAIGGRIPIDNDTSMGPGSLRAALLATGAGCLAIDHVMAGSIRRAFCATRPPGHHAEKSLAMGFCLFNNVAVAALHAIEHHGLRRVAIVDFDVHNGNGTVDIFKNDERVMVCSSFQHPFYPNRHFDTLGDHLILTPINAGSKGHEFRQKVERDFFLALDRFSPELLLISAGFDAHTEDPLGGLNLIEDDYRWITSMINDVANRHSQSRIVSMLEGGYHLDALGRSVSAHIETMLND
ncbi:MAG TPA: deacetylase [Gammaproteobacteria bacterium]|nr:deacetylase [Gammaproteobacteria bacterium]